MIWPTLSAVLLSVSCSNSLTSESVNKTSEEDLLERLLDPNVFDPTIRPVGIKENATRVEVDLVLNSVGPVNDLDMEMTSSFFLRQQWRDMRLAFNDFNHTLVISEKRLPSLWVPDLFFPQSGVERRHVITTPNIMLRLSPDGTVLYSQRLTVTVQCYMDLARFPLDKQRCAIRMESYSYTANDVYFTWSSSRTSASLRPSAYIPDFSITGTTVEDCTATYETGTFTCIKTTLDLEREIGFYVTQTYIPSILIVMLSWASFWIDHEAVPARISVGLLTVLTITTQSSGVRAQLPRVPYVKAIDIWMSLCLVFVFAAYMEYAVVTVLSRKYKKQMNKSEKKETASQDDSNVSISTIVTIQENPDGDLCKDGKAHLNDPLSPRKVRETCQRHSGRFVDKLSRFLFPLAFLIFNLVYWFYYIYA